MAKHSTPITETQSNRRVKYGLNVLVAVLAAMAIVVVINWISYRYFRSGATRWDLTSTRQYSLAPLTNKVLDKINGEVKLITLMDASDESFEDTSRARDLIDEYDRASDSLTAVHINPAIETGKLDDFRRGIHDRFADKLANLATGIKDIRHATQKAIDQIDNVYLPELAKILVHPDLKPDRNTLLLRDLDRLLKLTRKSLADGLAKSEGYANTTLPNYSATLIQLLTNLDGLDRQIYPSLIKNILKPLGESTTLSDNVKNEVLTLSDVIKQPAAKRLELMKRLKTLQGVPAYDQIVSQLALPNPVVIMAEKQVVVLPIDELFRKPANTQGASDDAADLQNKLFLGEERITGILARMTYKELSNPPMIVFCRVGTGLATNPKREYLQLMERLQNMDFEVKIWDPTNKPAAIGRNAPPEAPPAVAEGQKAVWIILPGDPVVVENPLTTTVQNFVVVHVKKRMDLGDGAMIINRPESDTIALERILKEWGIKVEFDHIVLRHIVDNFGQNRPTSEHLVRNWPGEHPISKAVGEQGMQGFFSWNTPVRLAKETPTNIKYWPLIQLKGEDLWANFRTSELKGQAQTIAPEQPGNIEGESFTIAYAAEREAVQDIARGRLIVVGDNFWALDRFGSYTVQDEVTRRLTRVTPFPANHELFANSVLWLAGMDEMIAASSRSQDIARITAISPGGMKALKVTLLLGMPLGVLVIGMGVWWSRRG